MCAGVCCFRLNPCTCHVEHVLSLTCTIQLHVTFVTLVISVSFLLCPARTLSSFSVGRYTLYLVHGSIVEDASENTMELSIEIAAVWEVE